MLMKGQAFAARTVRAETGTQSHYDAIEVIVLSLHISKHSLYAMKNFKRGWRFNKKTRAATDHENKMHY